MFRNSQLLRRSKEIKGNEDERDPSPVAILADPYEAESGILVPILMRFGFRVLEARDGAAAFDLARVNNVGLVIASADMPKINGAQLCQKVREHNSFNTPFILISPNGEAPDKYVGHETFASDYSQRPLNLEEFESRVRAVLRAQSPDRISKANAPAIPLSPASKNTPAARMILKSTAPISAPPPNAQEIAEVKDVGLDIGSIDTETIDALLTPAYLAELDVRPEGAALYKESFLFIDSAMRCVDKNERIPLDKGFEIAKRIVGALSSDKSLMLLATDRTSPFSLRQHSLNVAVIGARISQTLRLTHDRQVRLCLAGMLHDLGSLKLPGKLISKHTDLTSAERAEMKRRPIYSAEMVTGYQGFDWLPQIVVQVYERENGSGYPYGLRTKDICEESRVLGVADVFEACLHRRPQRPAMTGYRALEVITASADTFGERTTKAMIRSFSVYPYNELVVLNTGEIGKVIDINTENPLRPIVRIMYTAQRIALASPRVIDLSRNSQLWITSAITLNDWQGEQSERERNDG